MSNETKKYKGPYVAKQFGSMAKINMNDMDLLAQAKTYIEVYNLLSEINYRIVTEKEEVSE